MLVKMCESWVGVERYRYFCTQNMKLRCVRLLIHRCTVVHKTTVTMTFSRAHTCTPTTDIASPWLLTHTFSCGVRQCYHLIITLSQHLRTYMHIVCFICCFYLLFQLHIICYPGRLIDWMIDWFILTLTLT